MWELVLIERARGEHIERGRGSPLFSLMSDLARKAYRVPSPSQQASPRFHSVTSPLSYLQLRGMHCSEGPLADVPHRLGLNERHRQSVQRSPRRRGREGIGGDEEARERMEEGATKEGEG